MGDEAKAIRSLTLAATLRRAMTRYRNRSAKVLNVGALGTPQGLRPRLDFVGSVDRHVVAPRDAEACLPVVHLQSARSTLDVGAFADRPLFKIKRHALDRSVREPARAVVAQAQWNS